MIRVGLSPPTRGSLDGRLADRLVLGSIPAHAGEPADVLSGSKPTRWSIPAHAGEPLATGRQHELSATIWSRLHQDMSKNTSLRIGWCPPDKEYAVGIPDFLRRIPQVA